MEDCSNSIKEQAKNEQEQFSEERINFKLSLRKKKYNDILSKKRIMSMNPEESPWSYELYLSKLNLPTNYKKLFAKDEELITKYLFENRIKHHISKVLKLKKSDLKNKKIIISIFSQNRDLAVLNEDVSEKIKEENNTPEDINYLKKIGFIPGILSDINKSDIRILRCQLLGNEVGLDTLLVVNIPAFAFKYHLRRNKDENGKAKRYICFC